MAEKKSRKSADLCEQIKGNFDKNSKVVETKLSIGGSDVSVFYIESIIDKKLFAQGVLAPLEKLASGGAGSGGESGGESGGSKRESSGSSSGGGSSGGGQRDKKKPAQNDGNFSGQGENKSESQNFGNSSGQENGKKSGQESDKAGIQKDDSQSSQNRGNPSAQNTSESTQTMGENALAEKIMSEIVSVSSSEIVSDPSEILQKIFMGYVAIVLKNCAVCCPIFSVEARSIAEPPTSRVIKGPREGFIEDIYVNTGLIRKRIKSPNLKIEDVFVGKQTHTQVSLFYLDKIAKKEVVDEVKERLNTIDIDAIIDSYYIESLLERDKLKFFRRVGNTEKPDVFCAKILEGRVGLVVDGSPIALTVPFIMFEDLQSPGDYYTIPTMASFERLMRIMGLVFAILIPGIYVALQSYNYSILPINFLIALLSSIEGLSIPPLIEILLVLFLFEIITEASLQMPNALGMALSIIGALALGNTAVDAGIISPPSVVIVAISSVTLYIIPEQISETRILRILFTTIGGVIGLYGVLVGFIILTAYLCEIKSFGVPYLVPLAPSVKSDKKDAYIKQSVQAMRTRPKFFAGKNKVRQRDLGLNEKDKDKANENKNESKTNENKNQRKPSKSGGLKKSKEGESDK